MRVSELNNRQLMEIIYKKMLALESTMAQKQEPPAWVTAAETGLTPGRLRSIRKRPEYAMAVRMTGKGKWEYDLTKLPVKKQAA